MHRHKVLHKHTNPLIVAVDSRWELLRHPTPSPLVTAFIPFSNKETAFLSEHEARQTCPHLNSCRILQTHLLADEMHIILLCSNVGPTSLPMMVITLWHLFPQHAQM